MGSDSPPNDGIQLRLIRRALSHRGGVGAHQRLQCGDVVLLEIAQCGRTDSVLCVTARWVAHELQQSTLALPPGALLQGAKQRVRP